MDRILIIEDDRESADYLVKAFREVGHVADLASERIPPPLDWKLTVGSFILNANDLIALVVAPLTIAAVALFLTRTRAGLAVRASAERSDRAAMLGIPVTRLNTVVWALAAASHRSRCS